MTIAQLFLVTKCSQRRKNERYCMCTCAHMHSFVCACWKHEISCWNVKFHMKKIVCLSVEKSHFLLLNRGQPKSFFLFNQPIWECRITFCPPTPKYRTFKIVFLAWLCYNLEKYFSQKRHSYYCLKGYILQQFSWN